MAHEDDDHGIRPGLIEDVPVGLQLTLVGHTDEIPYGEGGAMVSVRLWRAPADDRRHHGAVGLPRGVDNPDGADATFDRLMDFSPEVYRQYAEDSYEVEVGLEAVREKCASPHRTDCHGNQPEGVAHPTAA